MISGPSFDKAQMTDKAQYDIEEKLAG